MNPIFHIGYPKTATTWLQKKFFPSITNATYIPRDETFEMFIQPSHFEFDPDYIRKKYAPNIADVMIFSLEGFVGTTHNFGLNGYLTAEHAFRIQRVFPEARIVLFIRKQPDIIASSYIQYIKGGGTYSIKKYLYHQSFLNIRGLPLFNWKYFEYHHVIKLYRDLFGSRNVYIFLYEDFAKNGKEFLQRMTCQLNLQVDLSKINMMRVNPSYRRIIKILALVANRFTERKMLNKYYLIHIPGMFRLSKKILNKLNQYKIFGKFLDSESVLGRKFYKEISDYYKRSNRSLIEMYGLEQIWEFDYPI